MCFDNKLDIFEILDDIIEKIKILRNVFIDEKNKDIIDNQKIKNNLHDIITLLLAIMINKQKYKNNKLKNKILDIIKIIKIIKDELIKLFIIENYLHDDISNYINQIELFVYKLENISK
jgi:hypothetical protein